MNIDKIKEYCKSIIKTCEDYEKTNSKAEAFDLLIEIEVLIEQLQKTTIE